MSLALLPPNAHTALSKELSRQIQRMQDAHGAYVEAADIITDITVYSVFRAATALGGIGLLRQAAALQGALTPDMSQQLDGLALDYLTHVREINEHAAARIMALADEVARGRVGVVEAVSRLLTDNNHKDGE